MSGNKYAYFCISLMVSYLQGGEYTFFNLDNMKLINFMRIALCSFLLGGTTYVLAQEPANEETRQNGNLPKVYLLKEISSGNLD